MSIDTDEDLTADTATSLAEEAQPEERTLPGKRCRVVLADGTELFVRITNREYIGWDKTAPRKKWGSMGDVPFLAATFMAWLAAKREDLTVLSWEQWQTVVEECETLAEEPEDLARPTRRAAGPGSS